MWFDNRTLVLLWFMDMMIRSLLLLWRIADWRLRLLLPLLLLLLWRTRPRLLVSSFLGSTKGFEDEVYDRVNDRRHDVTALQLEVVESPVPTDVLELSIEA